MNKNRCIQVAGICEYNLMQIKGTLCALLSAGLGFLFSLDELQTLTTFCVVVVCLLQVKLSTLNGCMTPVWRPLTAFPSPPCSTSSSCVYTADSHQKSTA